MVVCAAYLQHCWRHQHVLRGHDGSTEPMHLIDRTFRNKLALNMMRMVVRQDTCSTTGSLR